MDPFDEFSQRNSSDKSWCRWVSNPGPTDHIHIQSERVNRYAMPLTVEMIWFMFKKPEKKSRQVLENEHKRHWIHAKEKCKQQKLVFVLVSYISWKFEFFLIFSWAEFGGVEQGEQCRLFFLQWWLIRKPCHNRGSNPSWQNAMYICLNAQTVRLQKLTISHKNFWNANWKDRITSKTIVLIKEGYRGDCSGKRVFQLRGLWLDKKCLTSFW